MKYRFKGTKMKIKTNLTRRLCLKRKLRKRESKLYFRSRGDNLLSDQSQMQFKRSINMYEQTD